MKELFFFLSLISILWFIAYKDYKDKNIYLWSFYILNIISILFLFYFDKHFLKYLMLFYFIIIIFLDILEIYWKLPSFITKDWMINNTWIYDYWIYIFIFILFIDFWIFWDNFIWYYIWFTLSLILWSLIWFLISKKKYKKQIPLFVYWFFIISFMLIIIFILRLY